MLKETRNFYFLFVLLFLLPTALAVALPPGLQAAYEKTLANALNVTFLMAFLGGSISILSPCVLPFLPAFFAVTFRERERITLMTLVFLAGFSLVFVLLGLAATSVGTLLDAWKDTLVLAAGVVIILLGVATLFGVRLPAVLAAPTWGRHDVPGIFITGMAFAVGWTPCTGPILGSILLVAGSMHNYAYSAAMLLIYSIGFGLPLILLAAFYDRLRPRASWLGWEWRVRLFGREQAFALYNVISGTLLIMLGSAYIAWRGTAPINTSIDMFGFREQWYVLQREMIANPALANIIGGVLLLAFIAGLALYLRPQFRDKAI